MVLGQDDTDWWVRIESPKTGLSIGTPSASVRTRMRGGRGADYMKVLAHLQELNRNVWTKLLGHIQEVKMFRYVFKFWDPFVC